MKKLLFIISILFLSTSLFAQKVYELKWSSAGTTSDAVAFGRNDVPMAIFSTDEFSGTQFTFQYAEDEDSLFVDMKRDSSKTLVPIFVTFEDSTYIDLNQSLFLGAFSYLKAVSNASESEGNVLKVVTFPAK